MNAVITSGADREVESAVTPARRVGLHAAPDSADLSARDCPPVRFHCEITALPGETAAGTTFEAAFEIDGALTTRRTVAWMGRPTISAPMSVSNAVVGQRARVTRGTWSGGWITSPELRNYAYLGQFLFVCRDLSGTDCFTVGHETEISDPFAQRFAGWYLFVDEVFNSGVRDPFAPIPVIEVPRRVPRLPATGPLRARPAPVQVCCVLPAPAAVETKRAAAPTASIRARARRGRDGQLHVARVRCAVRCAVRLTVAGGGETVVRTLSVRGQRSLAIPARRGSLRVRVVVDGARLATGRSRAT